MDSIVFIPMQSQEPSHCPKCSRVENKVVVCKHCGYEYPEDDTSLAAKIFGVTIMILIVIFTFWFIATMFDWFLGHASLLDVIKSQWKFITSKRIW
jgi:hypothetical protein